MNRKDRKTAGSAIYEREVQLWEKARELQDNIGISIPDLWEKYKELEKEYGKLLKQTIKITRIGDSNQRKLVQANERIERQNEELAAAYKKMEMLARTDPLTSLSNRRHFMEKFQDELHRFERKGKSFSLVLGDIDSFKSVNDNYGHECGDQVLVALAMLIKSSVRKQDVVCRWGGEEFILMLPESPLEGGKIVAQEIRKKVANNIFVYREHRLTLTLTLGVSVFDGSMGIDACIKLADEAMYTGKQKGKNCVVVSGTKTIYRD